MLKPIVDIDIIIKKYKFNKCKGNYGDAGCYYKVMSINEQGRAEWIFLSSMMIAIENDWKNDPRIPKNPKIQYRCRALATDLIVEMARDKLIDIDIYG